MNTQFITEGKAKLQEEKGSALVSVLIIFSVLLILITSASSLALRNYKTSNKSLKKHAAYYLAEGQAHQFKEKAIYHIKKLSQSDITSHKATELSNHLTQSITPLLYRETNIMKEKANYSIILIPDSENKNNYLIQSMVKLGDQETSVELVIENLHELMDQGGTFQ